MHRTISLSSRVLATLLLLAGCGSADEAPPPAAIEAVTCAPHIDHYPVGGPYNGGYDTAWNDFRCDGARNNSDYGGDHHGNDIFAPRGTPIVSPVDGVVTRSGTASPTSGLRVTIADACGWSYYHGHLDSIAGGIAPGVRVRAGQILGTLGDTGTTGTAPHLHFNVHRDGDYSNDTDPYPLLQPAATTACGPDPQCAGRSDGSFCADATHLASCTGGRYSSGDCAAYGTTCDAPGGRARCAPHLDGVFVSSDFPGGTRIEVPLGAEVRGCLTYRNTGSWEWAPGTTKLGTTDPRDRASPSPGSDWLGPNRLATVSARTATGATGRFCFSVRAAGSPGERVERFSLVHEGFFWAADTGGVADATNRLTVVTLAPPPPTPPPPPPPPPRDAGASPRDAGVLAPDAGEGPTDAGAWPTDAGAWPSDGSSTTDGAAHASPPSLMRPVLSGGCSVAPRGAAPALRAPSVLGVLTASALLARGCRRPRRRARA